LPRRRCLGSNAASSAPQGRRELPEAAARAPRAFSRPKPWWRWFVGSRRPDSSPITVAPDSRLLEQRECVRVTARAGPISAQGDSPIGLRPIRSSRAANSPCGRIKQRLDCARLGPSPVQHLGLFSGGAESFSSSCFGSGAEASRKARLRGTIPRSPFVYHFRDASAAADSLYRKSCSVMGPASAADAWIAPRAAGLNQSP